LENQGVEDRQDSAGSEQDLMIGFYNHCSEPSGSINGEEFWLAKWLLLLKKDSVPWSYMFCSVRR
jgi:hypothetical protein